METISLTLPHQSYKIFIEPGAIRKLGSFVQSESGADSNSNSQSAGIVVDQAIAQTHGLVAQDSLKSSGYNLLALTMPQGEQYKSLATFNTFLNELLNAHLDRKSPIIALGGGVTCDTTGFVAASYMRGLPLIQCPTTLLAMVDASVGGKTGVNMVQGKNLVGAFYQPKAVVIDPDVLSTLPEREIRCGLAECIKHGMILDSSLLDWINENAAHLLVARREQMVELIKRNVQIKANVVMEDEKEQGKRAILNFGHTFAHAIEAGTKYKSCKHGEAVALGMVAATSLAINSGRCEKQVRDKLIETLRAARLPISANNLPDNKTLMQLMASDKKTTSGKLKFILPSKIGSVEITDNVSEQQINSALDTIRGENA